MSKLSARTSKLNGAMTATGLLIGGVSLAASIILGNSSSDASDTVIALLEDIKNLLGDLPTAIKSYSDTFRGRLERAVDTADALQIKASRYNLSTNDVQKGEYFAKKHGVDPSAMLRAMAKLQEMYGELGEGAFDTIIRITKEIEEKEKDLRERLAYLTVGSAEYDSISRQTENPYKNAPPIMLNIMRHGTEFAKTESNEADKIGIRHSPNGIFMAGGLKILLDAQQRLVEIQLNALNATVQPDDRKSTIARGPSSGRIPIARESLNREEIMIKEQSLPSKVGLGDRGISTSATPLNTAMTEYFASWTSAVTTLKQLVDELVKKLDEAAGKIVLDSDKAGAKSGVKSGAKANGSGKAGGAVGRAAKSGNASASLGSLSDQFNGGDANSFDNAFAADNSIAGLLGNVLSCLGFSPQADGSFINSPNSLSSMFAAYALPNSGLGGGSTVFNDHSTNNFKIENSDPMQVADKVIAILDRQRSVNLHGSWITCC